VLTNKFIKQGSELARLLACLCLFVCLLSADAATAQGLRPYEPLDPSKAQSLPVSPLTIESGETLHSFTVEVADTDSERAIGLMHRNHLAPDRGMLFDYKYPQRPRFWMRNTFIPLDMIFIDASGKIVHIAESVPPHSESTVGARRQSQAVLEVAAGTAKRLGLSVGDQVGHQIFGNLPEVAPPLALSR
jgi:uncharacterized membrane protein (UPF0127 family)